MIEYIGNDDFNVDGEIIKSTDLIEGFEDWYFKHVIRRLWGEKELWEPELDESIISRVKTIAIILSFRTSSSVSYYFIDFQTPRICYFRVLYEDDLDIRLTFTCDQVDSFSMVTDPKYPGDIMTIRNISIQDIIEIIK